MQKCLIRDLLKKPVFQSGSSKWVDILSTKTKQYTNRIHSSTKLTRIQASLEKNEGFVYRNLLDNRKKIKPKFEIRDLVRTGDLKKTFSKRETEHWSDRIFENTEIGTDTIPVYKIDNLPERYNEALLKKTKLIMKENESVMRKINIT